MSSLRKLSLKPFCNELHFYLIAVILLFIAIYTPYLCPLLIIYLIYIYKKTNHLKYILILICLFILILLIKELIIYYNRANEYIGVVEEIKPGSGYIIATPLVKIRVYDKENSFNVGDIIKISGHINEISPKGYSSDFDYSLYLKSKNIAYSFTSSKAIFLKRGFSLNYLKYKYLSYLSKILSADTYSYISSLVFADNILDKEIKDSFSALGISHILAISGMHIMILYKGISYIMLKLFNYYHSKIPLAIIAIYVLLIGLPLSSLRALLFLLIAEADKNNSTKYTRLDILSISSILMLLFNPYSIYNLGFILSYLVSFILIYYNELNIKNNSLINILKGYMLIYLITLPFIINMNNNISPISIILAPLLTPIISIILIPLSYLIALVPILDYLFKYIYLFLNSYALGLNRIIPIIKMPYLSPLIMVIYYYLYYLVIKAYYFNKKILIKIGLILIYLFSYKAVIVYNPIPRAMFLDCGQGDATILKEGDKVVLVDAFNSFSYLKSLGISKIDYFIITHSDSDHLGDYREVIDYFNIKKIIYPSYDDRLEDILAPYNNKLGIEGGYKIKLGGISMSFISPNKDYDNPNMNSLAMMVIIDGVRILLCADITAEVEHDLCMLYGEDLKCDILKAGHHGSITSSSEEFLSYTRPDISIISAGLNNKYHHPAPIVVKRLSAISRVYNTINDGSISVYILNRRYIARCYR